MSINCQPLRSALRDEEGSLLSRGRRHIKKRLRNLARKVLRFIHVVVLEVLCSRAHLLRRHFRPGDISAFKAVKVLHVTCSFDIGGTQRQIVNLCESNNGNIFSHDTIEIFPEANFLYRNGITMDAGRYVKRGFLARKLGHYVLNKTTRSWQAVQIYKLFRDFQVMRPDIVVGWGHEISMITFVAASFARVPKIVFCIRTFNPSNYSWLKIGPLLRRAHARMYPWIDGIVVNSSVLHKDYTQWLGIAEDKIFVCHNGMDCFPSDSKEMSESRVRLRRFYSIPENAILIISVGRFSREKGQMLLARAFRIISAKYKEKPVYCIFCGDGPIEGEIRHYAAVNNLKNMLFAGRVDNVHEYLSASDIFVMPSDIEGMPNAMMEAMCYGLPTVSTNRSGALDIARDNFEALFIDVGSEQQLAQKLAFLIENDKERSRIGINAGKRIKEFSVSRMVARFNYSLGEILKQ